MQSIGTETSSSRDGDRKSPSIPSNQGDTTGAATKLSAQTNTSWVPGIMGSAYLGRLHGVNCLTEDGRGIDAEKCTHKPDEFLRPFESPGSRVLIFPPSDDPLDQLVIVAPDPTWAGTERSSVHRVESPPPDHDDEDEDDAETRHDRGVGCNDEGGNDDDDNWDVSSVDLMVDGQRFTLQVDGKKTSARPKQVYPQGQESQTLEFASVRLSMSKHA